MLKLIGIPTVVLVAFLCLMHITVPVEPVDVALDSPPQFCGERAYEITEVFVTTHENRHSGAPTAYAAADWIGDFMSDLGYNVSYQRFSAVLYSQDTDCVNVVGIKKGTTDSSIVIVVHHDQATTTVQGADNNGAGVGIMLHLAELLSEVETRHNIVFLSTDAEEYGMLGAAHYMDNHDDPDSIIAAISLDNVGRTGATGIHMAPVGQGRGYTDPHFATLIRATAAEIDVFIPSFPPPWMQFLEQAVNISFTDQGPFLGHGVHAVGFGVDTDHWPHYHGPTDTIEHICPETLTTVGRLTEALIYQLGAHSLPHGIEHVLYRTETDRYTAPVAIKVGTFLLLLPLAAAVWGRVSVRLMPAAGHILLLSIPVAASVVAIRLLQSVGGIIQFQFYPATPLDPVLYEPQWLPIAGVLIVATACGLLVGRIRSGLRPVSSEDAYVGGLVVLLAVSVAVWVVNPFCLVFVLPAAWLWPAMGRATWLRWLLFASGGFTLVGLLAFYGMMIQLGPYVLWYLVLMLASGMIAPYTVAAACVVTGSGVMMARRDSFGPDVVAEKSC